jgi:hypothetical protein
MNIDPCFAMSIVGVEQRQQMGNGQASKPRSDHGHAESWRGWLLIYHRVGGVLIQRVLARSSGREGVVDGDCWNGVRRRVGMQFLG